MDNNKAEQAPQVRLIGLSDPYKGKDFVIDKEDFLIGRSIGCDLIMPETTISGRHARIEKFGDHYEIVDLQSTNGTYLNGLRIERKHLRSEDKIRFDQFEFQFIDPSDVGRTFVRPSSEEMAQTITREPAPPAVAPPQPVAKAAAKGSLLAGTIVGLVVSFLVGLLGNAVMIYFSTPHGVFSFGSFGQLLHDIGSRYPHPHVPQVWLKQNFSDWRNIVSLALIGLAIILGGILVQAMGKRARAVSSVVFSLFYVILAVVIQLAIMKFKVQTLPGLYPSLSLGLSPWANFGVAVALFFFVVLVLSYIATLFVRQPKVTA